MNNGLFDLTNLESMKADDFIDMNINESNEFTNKTGDVNHPEVAFDTDGASGKQTSVSVPGGDGETPKAKPYDASSVSIPGGDSETPHAKPYDASSISVPSKVTLTSDQYNNALASLKKSFKEGAEIMEMLERVNVVETTLIDKQKEFVENAILTAYEDGPMFEAVKRDDKDEVKEIVRKIRADVAKDMIDDDVTFYKPNHLLSLIDPGAAARLICHVWTNRMWQVLGEVLIEKGNVDDLCKRLTTKYKDELGDYKIIPYEAAPTIIDLFRAKFNWKNQLNCYILIIDKKVPSEIVNATKQDEKDYKAEDNEDSLKKKDDKKKDK